MNCGDFRYLIQRRFDVELSPADDRALLIHLETCESCQKFYHQVQQVIIAAEEIEISEDILPQDPERLLNTVLENIPNEKPGIRATVLSFLSRIGIIRNNAEASKTEPASSTPEPTMPRRLLDPLRSSKTESARNIEGPSSHPITDWGRPNKQSTKFANGSQNKEFEIVAPSSQSEEQIITRSLRDKFGASGANNPLTTNQPLTLAESIRQRILEMSKTGGDYQNSQAPVELSNTEPMDEWSVPHSPEWPKLAIDAPPEEWPNELAGSKAPQAWGNALSGWGEQDQPVTSPMQEQQPVPPIAVPPIVMPPTNVIPDPAPPLNISTKSEAAINKPFVWSAEAEQLETGTWQTVEFDTTLGATNSSYSPPAVSLPNRAVIPPSPSNYLPDNVSPQLVPPPQAIEAPPVMRQVEEGVVVNNNDVQSFVPSRSNGPKIYPVVSRRARSSAPFIDSNTDLPAPEQPVLYQPTDQAPTEVPTEVPIEQATVVANPPELELPIINPTEPALIVQQLQELSPTVPETPKNAKVEDKGQHLFKFDDGAIDKLFSNNLGVHERSVSASSSIQPASTPSAIQPIIQPTIQPTIETNPAGVTPAPSAAAVAQPPAPVCATNAVIASDSQEKANSLFVVDDNMIDRIFTDHLGVSEQVSKNAVNPPVSQASLPEIDTNKEMTFAPNVQLLPNITPSQNTPLPPAQLKADKIEANKEDQQFGTSSSYVSSKQKIVGVGRLDNRVEPASDPGSGRIASIGKFLLDSKDLEKIGKITASDLSEGKMRTLTLEANEELKNLLKQIDAQQGVLGTLVVGHDGLLIAHTMSQDADAETLGVEAFAVFMGTVQIVEKLGDDNVRQIVSQTNQGYLIIANFGAGLLVTLTNPIVLDKLLPLMRTITQLVAA